MKKAMNTLVGLLGGALALVAVFYLLVLVTAWL